MPDLLPSASEPLPRPKPCKPPTLGPRAVSASQPDLGRIFSATYLDDVSTYHGGDHDVRHDPSDDSDGSLYSEKAFQEDSENVRRAGLSEVEGVEMGVRTTRDLESGLEKKKSTKPVKPQRDPNLVCSQTLSLVMS